MNIFNYESNLFKHLSHLFNFIEHSSHNLGTQVI